MKEYLIPAIFILLFASSSYAGIVQGQICGGYATYLKGVSCQNMYLPKAPQGETKDHKKWCIEAIVTYRNIGHINTTLFDEVLNQSITQPGDERLAVFWNTNNQKALPLHLISYSLIVPKWVSVQIVSVKMQQILIQPS